MSVSTALRGTIIRVAAVAAALGMALSIGPGQAGAAVDEQVRFAPGTNQAVRKNAVIRGESDSYRFEAGAWQRFSVVTTSPENNVSVDIIRPDGALMSTGTSSAEIELPESGNYTVKVSPTRGNASYELTVTIN